MRSRNLKPGYFKSDKLAECEPLARILFAGLWGLADFRGNLEYRPKRIKAEVLAYDDADISGLLEQLASAGFVRVYTVSGVGYLNIPNFLEHQNPHKKEREAGTNIPMIPDDWNEPGADRVEAGASPADSLLLIPDSGSLIPASSAGVGHLPTIYDLEFDLKDGPMKISPELGCALAVANPKLSSDQLDAKIRRAWAWHNSCAPSKKKTARGFERFLHNAMTWEARDQSPKPKEPREVKRFADAN